MTYDLDNPEDNAKILAFYMSLSPADLDNAEETVRETLFILETARELKKQTTCDQ